MVWYCIKLDAGAITLDAEVACKVQSGFDIFPPVLRSSVALTFILRLKTILPKPPWELSSTLAMDPNSTTLLPGQSPPLTIITPTNQSGIVLIVTTLALTTALISILIRVYMQLKIRRQYSHDDFLALISMVSGNTLLLRQEGS